MRSVVLLIFSLAEVDQLIERSLQLTLEGNHRLDVYFAIEKQMPSTLSSVMGHIGFLGDKVQDDVRQAIINNYKARIDDICEDINNAAKKSGVETSISILDTKGYEDLFNQNNFDQADMIIINYHQEINQLIKRFIGSVKAPVEFYIDGKRAAL